MVTTFFSEDIFTLAYNNQSLEFVPSNSVLIMLQLVGSVSIHAYWGFYCVPGNKAELCPQKAQSCWVLVYTQGRNSQKHLTHSCQTLEGLKISWKACYKTSFWASTYILGFFFFFTSMVSDSPCLRWDLRICISNKFPVMLMVMLVLNHTLGNTNGI